MNAPLVIANICRIACPTTGNAFAHGIDHATDLQQTGDHIAPGGGDA